MANSRLSGLTDRAGGALSGIRSRFGGSSRNRDDADYADYPDYGEYGYDAGASDDRYGRIADYEDYGEYGYDPDEPYDDYTDAEGIGEVRTRTPAPSARSHPPLVSFQEARTNTYVPDRLRAGASRQSSYRSASAARTSYTPRVRDAVNVGYASEYDFASVGGARLDASGVEIPPVDVVPHEPGQADAAARAPRPTAAQYPPPVQYAAPAAAVSQAPRTAARKLKVLAPASYGEAEAVASALKAGDVVVLALSRTPAELAKRVLDFSFGAASALDAGVECIADKTFAVCRGEALGAAERDALAAQGVIAR